MTKVAGVAASYSSSLGWATVPGLVCSFVSMPTIVAGLFVLTLPTAALACVESAPNSGVFVCDDDQTLPQFLSANGTLLDVTVSEDASFEVDQGGLPIAITLEGDSGISFVQGTPGGAGAGRIDSTGYGILADATGGDVDISVVTNVGDGNTEEAAIAVIADVGVGSINVQTGEGNIDSQKYGFVASSSGSGGITFNGGDSGWIRGGYYGIKTTALGDNPDTTITVQGAVIGLSADGISAQHGNASTETGGDITIQTGDGDVTGGRHGINAENYDDGDVSITGGAGAISGGERGVNVQNKFTGSTDITVEGAVTGTNDSAIYVNNGPTIFDIILNGAEYGPGTLEITTGDGEINAGKTGIEASNTNQGGVTLTTGTGAITGDREAIAVANIFGGSVDIYVNADLTATGTNVAPGTTNHALRATNGIDGDALTITVETGVEITATGGGGDAVGILAASSGSGDVTLDLGSVTIRGGESGIDAANRGADVNVNINGGYIFGGFNSGIYAQNYPGAGSISISTGSAEVIGNRNGIRTLSRSSGNIDITTGAGGSITGIGGAAIFAYNRDGSDGNATITIGGEVSGITGATQDAVRVINEGTGDATVTSLVGSNVTGAYDGIDISNNDGDVVVDVDGAVTGTAGDAITVVNGDDGNATGNAVTVATGAGAITGGQNGIDVTNEGTGGVTVQGGAGAITGAQDAILVDNTNGGAVSVTVSGAVTGGGAYSGISVANAVGGSTLSVTTGAGDVTGGNYGVAATNDGTGDLFFNYGTAGLGATGAITGGSSGVALLNQNGGSVRVTTVGDVTGELVDGIRAGNNASATASALFVHTSAGEVDGARYGVNAYNEGSGTLRVSSEEGGSITGGDDGIKVTSDNGGAVQVAALGAVTGETGAAIDVDSNEGGDSVTVTTGTGAIDGATNAILVNNTGDGGITIDGGIGAITSDSLSAIRLSNLNGGDTVVVITGDVTSGSRNGIQSYSSGYGDADTTVSISGDQAEVTGARDGIALTQQGGQDLSVTTAAGTAVGGGRYGISAFNNGAGTTTINVDGAVTASSAYDPSGSARDAINVSTGYDSTTLSVTTGVGDISGARNGVSATHNGSEDLTVQTGQGSVEGAAESGIYARSTGSGGLNITGGTGEITGYFYGIFAENTNGGAVDIGVSGDVTGTSGDGIYAENDENGTTLTVSTAAGTTVSGAADGIDARNDGTGLLTVEALGAVTGDGGSGVYARNTGSGGIDITGGDGAIAGSNFGIFTENTNGGAVDIDVSGDVTGTADAGIYASNDEYGTTLTVSTGTGTTVHGGAAGIDARNDGTGLLTVEALGAVAGDTGSGVYAKNTGSGGLNVTGGDGAIEGALNGVLARNTNGGAVEVSVSGSVTGSTFDGVHAENGDGGSTLSVTTGAGDIYGAQNGIFASKLGDDDLTIQTGAGAVEGGSNHGIVATISGTGGLGITGGTGAITGAINGMFAQNANGGAVDIGVSGDVTGISGGAISALNGVGGTTLTIETGAGTIQGDLYGIEARNFGTGDLQITGGAGEILGTQSGVYAKNYNGGDTTVSVTGDVTGTNADAIFVDNIGTSVLVETGSGEIQSGMQFGINVINTGDTSNAGSEDLTVRVGTGKITSYLSGVATNNQGEGETNVSVEGEIEVTGLLAGINVTTGFSNTDTNVTTGAGDVTGGYLSSGVKVNHQGTGTLTITGGEGTITGDTVGIEAENLRGLETNINVTHDVTGQISFGISALNSGTAGAMSISTGAGEIYGGRSGIYARAFGEDVSITGGSGEISGGDNGVEVENFGVGSANIDVSGNVSGDAEDGINVRNGGTATSLTITTGADAIVSGGIDGIDARNDGSGTLVVQAQASVIGESGTGISAYTGINNTGGISIEAVDVTGGVYGVYAENYGTGGISIVTTGDVTADTDEGIYAYNGAYSLEDLSIEAVNVSGGYSGIIGNDFGGGSVTIRTTGTVSGAGYNGIYSRNEGDGDITILAATTSGLDNGIRARQYGTGGLTITATGATTASDPDGTGILANVASTGQGALTIAAAEVSGGENGIYARNEGLLGIDIIGVGGDIDGGESGISASNFGGGAVSVRAVDDVAGGTLHGILAFNDASGTSVSVTTIAGDVQGGEVGVLAENNGSGDLTFTGIAGSITGGDNGIELENNGESAVIATINGAVTGTNATGVKVSNTNADGTYVDVQTGTGAITAGTYGVVVSNVGTGDLTFTGGTGAITGDWGGVILQNQNGGAVSASVQSDVTGVGNNYDGIVIGNGSGGTSLDLTITDASVQGGQAAVYASNRGTEDLTITATGDGAISGVYDGIRARNYYGGAVSISVEGDVTGTRTRGILAVNDADGTSMTISTGEGAIEGGTAGVIALNRGSGGLTFTGGSGSITGVTEYGVVARNYNGGDVYVSVSGDVTSEMAISGEYDALNVINNAGGGSVTVKTGAGTISGTDGGIQVTNRGVGDLDFEGGTGLITGRDGLVVSHANIGDVTVSIAGDVTATGGRAISVSKGLGFGGVDISLGAGSINGTLRGVSAVSSGTGDLTFTGGTGSITSGGHGVELENNGESAVIATITGAVTATSGDAIGVTVSNTNADGTYVDVQTGAGAITAGGYGVVVSNAGIGDLTFTGGAGAITGAKGGVILQNQNGGSVSASVQSDVTGERNNYYGILIDNGAGGTSLDLTITDASVQGGTGVLATNNGTGDLTIEATGDGAIAGFYDGIRARSYYGGAVAISVEGDVTGTAGRGILAYNGPDGTSVSVTTGAGDVAGGDVGVLAGNNGSGDLTFSGGAGSITGGGDGIILLNQNGGALSASVQSDVTGLARYGINAVASGGGITVDTTDGSVSGHTSGIYAKDFAGAIAITTADVEGT
ncbi:MAG: hypothetical protein ABJN34_14655, partial [Litoreibacter sp.]